jgi:hypothetical protein
MFMALEFAGHEGRFSKLKRYIPLVPEFPAGPTMSVMFEPPEFRVTVAPSAAVPLYVTLPVTPPHVAAKAGDDIATDANIKITA